MLTVILCIVGWYLIGIIFWIWNDAMISDFRMKDLPVAIFIGGTFGLLTVIIVLFILFMEFLSNLKPKYAWNCFWNKTLIKQLGKK